MPSAVLEPAIKAIKRPEAYALDRTATLIAHSDQESYRNFVSFWPCVNILSVVFLHVDL